MGWFIGVEDVGAQTCSPTRTVNQWQCNSGDYCNRNPIPGDPCGCPAACPYQYCAVYNSNAVPCTTDGTCITVDSFQDCGDDGVVHNGRCRLTGATKRFGCWVGSGGGGKCSDDSEAKCVGLDPRDSCGNNKECKKDGSKTGSDGKPICKCRNIPAPPSCNVVRPTGLNETNVTDTSARLNWTPGSGGNRQALGLDDSLTDIQNDCPGQSCLIKETNLGTGVSSYNTGNILSSETTYYWKVVTFKSASCRAGTNRNFTTLEGKGTVRTVFFDADLGGTCGVRQPRIEGINVSIDHLPPAPDGDTCKTSVRGNTDPDGVFERSNLCAGAGGDTYEITINDASPYLDEPALVCNGFTATISGGQTRTRRFGMGQIYDAWFQVEGSGNVQAGGRIRSKIPPACTGSCDPNFVSVSGEDPGLVAYGGVKANFDPGGQVSEEGWLANSSYGGKQYGYQLFFNQLGFSATTPADFIQAERTNLTKPTAPPLSGSAYLARGDVFIRPEDWQVNAGETIVILVDGNLSIRRKIRVEEGGFLMFIVSGDIEINSNVNSTDGQGAVEGIYVADGTFSTGEADTKLIVEGTFVGWTGVSLQRDFDSTQNNTEAAEVFRYRPDLVVNVPIYLSRPNILWQEVAP